MKPSDDELLQRWRTTGDEEAASEIYKRYAERLWRLAKNRIGQRFGRRLDAEDVVQSVFRTFFRRAKKGKYTIASTSTGTLWSLLAKITLSKVLRQVEFHTAEKRNVDAEIVSPEAVACAPAPESTDILIDQLDHIFTGLNETQQKIVWLCLEGFSQSEIAKQVGYNRSWVGSVLKRVAGRLERQWRKDCGN